MNPSSFENARDKWFPEVRHHCPGVPCILVGTQLDLRGDRAALEKMARHKQKPVTKEMGEKLASDMNAYNYMECSALTQVGVKDVFDEAINAALEPPKKKSKKCTIL